MCGSSVAFVLCEFIDGILLVERQHQPVARYLGDHTRRGNAETQSIAPHERRLLHRKRAHRQTVDEHMLRLRRQSHHGPAHSLVSRAEDVNAVDFLRLHDGKTPHDRAVRREFREKRIALPVRELLRIVQHRVREAIRQNHRRRHHRPRERTAPRFIHACDKTQTSRTKIIFVREAANL